MVGLGEVGGAIAAILDRNETVLRHDLEPLEIEASIRVLHLCIPFQSHIQFEGAALRYIERFKPELTDYSQHCTARNDALNRDQKRLRTRL